MMLARFGSPPEHWTADEDKVFEKALAEYEGEGRWLEIASLLPGKSSEAVYRRYTTLEDDVRNIEAGRVPLPDYGAAKEAAEAAARGDGEMATTSSGRKVPKASAMTKTADQERRKGIPWTEDEHRLFLLGLQKFGKGDWRSISRNYVISRTPTQVASHAQKYFIRLNTGSKKDKRRSSIHDIRDPWSGDQMMEGSQPASYDPVHEPMSTDDFGGF
eukprot:CAMPEP_0170134236 /NCGR_PEP_ID=MMETSP0033_2-20121228/1776_1 /TAXON_ID=195969 /ORGANISM="Dolichomastix tenuilepis, Strain CCMP3274" /LENGTH=215 /DNA_ID=CAMNT_0010369781 /DNA_START=111 /DNA_END=758 /DNA_ORIENTATION=+